MSNNNLIENSELYPAILEYNFSRVVIVRHTSECSRIKLLPILVIEIIGILCLLGNGSEVTEFTIITDEKTSRKLLLRGKVLMPKIAIIDPTYSFKTPKNVTAATGLEALTHAVEAYTSKKASDFSDRYAVSAIQRIFQFLPNVYENREDEVAREEVAIAAYEAGVGFNN